MAVNDPTTRYGWDIPDVAGDNDAWGTGLNEMVADVLGAIDSMDEVIGVIDTTVTAEEARIVDLDERTERLESLAPRPAYARLYLGAAVTISKATLDILDWDTEHFDKGDCADLSAQPTRLTVPANRDGLFTIRGVVSVPASTGSGDDAASYLLRILKNGSECAIARVAYLNDGHDSAKSGNRSILVEALDNAVAGDYYELEITYDYNDTGAGSVLVAAGSMASYFEIYRHRSPTVQVEPTVGGFIYSANSTTTTHDIALPVESRVSGQMLLVIFGVRANVTMTEVAGYTKIADSGAASAVSDGKVLFRRITAAESGGGTITIETNLGRQSASVVFLLNDADAGNDPEAEIVASDASEFGADFAMNCPPLTPTWGAINAFWITAFSEGGAGADEYLNAPTDPAGYAQTSPKEIFFGADVRMAAATRAGATASEDPDAFKHTILATGIVYTIGVPGASIT